MFQTKVVEENRSPHFIYSNFFLGGGDRAVYEIMWKNTVESDRPQKTLWRMRFAGCITKATNTHSEYVILIVFPLQQWFSRTRHNITLPSV